MRYLLLCLSLVLAACTSRIEQQQQQASQRLQQLSEHLQQQDLTNSKLLSTYARLLSQKHPEYAELAQSLAKEGRLDGQLFKGLQQRLEQAKNSDQFDSTDEQFEELNAITEAAEPAIFNDSLTDPINVLADLSQGELPRIQADQKDQSLKTNQAKDYGPGSQLIGNPHYGHWTTNSSGNSVWEWFAAYALLSSLSNQPAWSRNDWLSHRDYSYYQDNGRYRYTSVKQRADWFDSPERRNKSFTGANKRSSYSSGSSSWFGSKNESSYSRASNNKTSSFFGGSSRRSYSSSGRGVSRGK